MDNFFIVQSFDEWKPKQISSKAEWINSLFKKLGMWIRLAPPHMTGGMCNVEQRINMYHLVSQVLAADVRGDLVELGCNHGESSVVIRQTMDQFGTEREFHAFDSFEGLPETEEGKAGNCKASREEFVGNFQQLGLRLPEIHKGWFEDTLTEGLPTHICFAHLDGDLYESTRIGLEHLYPRLSRGGICVVDDYCDTSVNPNGFNLWPGVKKACDEFLAERPEKVTFLYSGYLSHGYFRKL